MALIVEKRTLLDLQQRHTLGLLDFAAGGIQRKLVFQEKEKSFLIDSLARKLPMGALTIYVADGDGDIDERVWEVIDGKQRMTTILSYISGDFTPTSGGVRSMMESPRFSAIPPPPQSDLADDVVDRLYDDLTPTQKNALLGYFIPVYLVTGSREDAVRVFARMNSVSYVLKPQEMRNAIFRDSPVLEHSVRIAEALNGDVQGDETPDIVEMSIIGKQRYERMSDVELASELLFLAYNNNEAMHRRDELDAFYQELMEPDDRNTRLLEEASEGLIGIIGYVKEIFNGQSLRGFHFRSPEQDYYALIGGFLHQGLPNRRQMDERREVIQDELSSFHQAVTLTVEALRTQEQPDYPEDEDIMSYAGTFTGGQQNSNTKRNIRIACVARIVSRVFSEVGRPFTDYQRALIWARSINKDCPRCGQEVEYADYEAGHKISRADGGRSTIENGQVEHRECNRAAGPN